MKNLFISFLTLFGLVFLNSCEKVENPIKPIIDLDTTLFTDGNWTDYPWPTFPINTNTEINVLIEGHTDDVPLSGKGKIKDNWDLSVLRATSIVKILLTDSGIDAKRLTPAGRGEFLPLDIADTPEARTKNRRTEIILTPRLDELFEILENN